MSRQRKQKRGGESALDAESRSGFVAVVPAAGAATRLGIHTQAKEVLPTLVRSADNGFQQIGRAHV